MTSLQNKTDQQLELLRRVTSEVFPIFESKTVNRNFKIPVVYMKIT